MDSKITFERVNYVLLWLGFSFFYRCVWGLERMGIIIIMISLQKYLVEEDEEVEQIWLVSNPILPYSCTICYNYVARYRWW